MSSLRYPQSPSADAPLTLSSLSSEKRIPHLETNAYIYQSSSLGLSPSLGSDRYSRPLVSPKFSHESLKEAIDRRIVDKDLEYGGDRMEGEGTLQGRMQTLDMEIEQHLEHSRVREIEERVQRRQAAEAHDRIRTIEQTIDERSRAESLKSLHSPARRIAVVPLDQSIGLYSSEPRKRSKSAKRAKNDSKYEFINDKYSKFNTKSPYAKSTFSHDVRSMENKAYTYLRHSADGQSRGSSKARQRTARGRGEDEVDFLRKVLMLAEAHAKRCPDLRIELNRVRREFGLAD